MTTEIRLGQFKRSEEKIFTDRDKGIEARRTLDLDSLEENNDIVNVLLPTDIWTVNPSFFGGLFEQSIKKYRDKFWDKYKFLYTDNSELSESVKASIEYDFDYVLTHME